MELQHPEIKKIEASSKYLRFFYFVSGIIATIAYRIVLWLNPFWAQVVWYVGTIGFIVYFGHRTVIETKRAKMVKENNLIDAVSTSNIPEDKREMLLYLTKTSVTSKARFNSLFIFLASVVALIINIYLYFIKH